MDNDGSILLYLYADLSDLLEAYAEVIDEIAQCMGVIREMKDIATVREQRVLLKSLAEAFKKGEGYAEKIKQNMSISAYEIKKTL